jgi:hypothetical protein
MVEVNTGFSITSWAFARVVLDPCPHRCCTCCASYIIGPAVVSTIVTCMGYGRRFGGWQSGRSGRGWTGRRGGCRGSLANMSVDFRQHRHCVAEVCKGLVVTVRALACVVVTSGSCACCSIYPLGIRPTVMGASVAVVSSRRGRGRNGRGMSRCNGRERSGRIRGQARVAIDCCHMRHSMHHMCLGLRKASGAGASIISGVARRKWSA